MKRRKGDSPLSENYVARIVAAMKATGNQPGIIQQWVEASAAWALANPGPDAEAIKVWLPHWQARPFYTAEELAPMLPALAVVFGYAKCRPVQWSANRLANALDFLGLPVISVISPGKITSLLRHPVSGVEAKFYAVEQVHHWGRTLVEIEDFKEVFRAHS